ncbi:MAG: AAA family ATPase [Paramuribaculum sp.]|nr:AAA family ATPase [Paramuribaculum sp.]
MDLHDFAEQIFLSLPYDPNEQQIQLIAALARFCSPQMPSDSVFLLNGYAGTGKTSVTGALVQALRGASIPVVLLAPTGRAAKVFGKFARFPATTIHRRIYRQSGPGGVSFTGEVADNNMQGAVFIVDEASMIGDDSGSASRTSLLEDLVHYVYSGVDCRMILLGDTAQLPPVGCERSPAMDPDVLRGFGLRVTRAVMTKVVRQDGRSGILHNATWLRKAMRVNPLPQPRLVADAAASDVRTVCGEDLLDLLSKEYAERGVANSLIITRSNKRATQFNLGVRSEILGYEEELCVEDRLLVAKNNYLWSAKVKELDFIANGDIATVSRILGMEHKYGLRFANVVLVFPDKDVEVECKIMLDALTSDTPALDPVRFNKLYTDILNDPELFTHATPMNVRMKLLRTDPYFNALQVKYAYAVTCHKSQGGQWESVFVDMGYIPPEAQGLDFYRWLYTATTRATRKLYYINPRIMVNGKMPDEW